MASPSLVASPRGKAHGIEKGSVETRTALEQFHSQDGEGAALGEMVPKEVCKVPRKGDLRGTKRLNTSTELPGLYLSCQKQSSFLREVLSQMQILQNPPDT